MQTWSELKPSTGAHIQRDDGVCKLRDIDAVAAPKTAFGMEEVFTTVCGEQLPRRMVSLTCYYPNATMEPVSCPTCLEIAAKPPVAPLKKWTPPGKPWSPGR